MKTDVEILQTSDSAGGRFTALLGDDLRAEMTYFHHGEKVIVIDHTYVPPAFEGRGIALALVKSGIEFARANALKIVPQCAYVAVQFRRHRDWHDVLAKPL